VRPGAPSQPLVVVLADLDSGQNREDKGEGGEAEAGEFRWCPGRHASEDETRGVAHVFVMWAPLETHASAGFDAGRMPG
jgi:hypothetical protein